MVLSARYSSRWTGPKPFFYSEHLAVKLGIVRPAGQLCFYGGCLGGLGYAARSFWFTHMLMKLAHEPDPVKAKEMRLIAGATVDQVKRAALYASRFRTHGVIYGLCAPLLWTVYNLSRLAPKLSGKP